MKVFHEELQEKSRLTGGIAHLFEPLLSDGEDTDLEDEGSSKLFPTLEELRRKKVAYLSKEMVAAQRPLALITP